MKYTFILVGIMVALASQSTAQPYQFSNYPLVGANNFPSHTLLVMGRDHQLFKPAYTIFSDADQDGAWDFDFKPHGDYSGLFSPRLCYQVMDTRGLTPSSWSDDGRCAGRQEWSGLYLNYLTTSRMDLVRHAWYGGYRRVDTIDETWLERARFSFQSSGWALGYESPETNGYDIRDYSPLDLPAAGGKHLFANGNHHNEPVLSVHTNTMALEPWEWLEQLASDRGMSYCPAGSVERACRDRLDLSIVVRVCMAPYIDTDQCRAYHSAAGNVVNKPTGVLHNLINQTRVGLMTGSYDNPFSGGILRMGWSDIDNFIDPETGVFRDHSLMHIVDRLDMTEDGCVPNSGNQYCSFTGNPIGEMMWEAYRYHHGATTATRAYASGSVDRSKNLPVADWTIHDETSQQCAAKNLWLISGGEPTDDTDDLPGAVYGQVPATELNGRLVNIAQAANDAWQAIHRNGFNTLIGQRAPADTLAGLPLIRWTDNFNGRGLAPDMTQLSGGYSSAVLSSLFGEHEQGYRSPVIVKSLHLEGEWREQWHTLTGVLPFAMTMQNCDGRMLATPQMNGIRAMYANHAQQTPTGFTMAIDFINDPRRPAVSDAVFRYTMNAQQSELSIHSLHANPGRCLSLAGSLAGITAMATAPQHMDVGAATRETPISEAIQPFTSMAPGSVLSSSRTYDLRNAEPTTLLESPLKLAAHLARPASEEAAINENYFTVDTLARMHAAAARDHKPAESPGSVISSIQSVTIGVAGPIAMLLTHDRRTWRGDISAYALLDSNQERVALVNGVPQSRQLWSAQRVMNQSMANGGHREVFTWSGNRGVALQWEHLTPADQQRLSNNVGAQVDGNALIASLVGNPGESSTGYQFRDFEQTPLHVMLPPRQERLGEAYEAFKQRYRNRGATVFTFSNDGQLHAIDANSGQELFAYIPSSLLPTAAQMARSSRHHPLMVNGDITVQDAEIDGRWRTVLIASFGGAAKGLMALDVTDPRDFSAEHILWETPASLMEPQPQNRIGHIFSGVSIVRGAHSRWMVVTGDGLNTQTSARYPASDAWRRSSLVFIDIADGDIIRTLDFHSTLPADWETGLCNPETICSKPNGMGPPAVVDLNADQVVDTVYAGDAYGQLWRADIRSTDPAEWRSFYQQGARSAPVFITQTCLRLHRQQAQLRCTRFAERTQPILTRPQVTRFPQASAHDDVLIALGTGKALEPNEFTTASQSVQSFYVIRDPGRWDGRTPSVVSREELQPQAFLSESRIGSGREQGAVRISSADIVDYTNQRGWVLDFASGTPQRGHSFDLSSAHHGERLLDAPSIIYGDRVRFISVQPTPVECRSMPRLWETTLRLTDGHPVLQLSADSTLAFDAQINNETIISSVHFPLPEETSMTDIPLIIDDSDMISLWPSTSFEHTIAPTQVRAMFRVGRQNWRELAK